MYPVSGGGTLIVMILACVLAIALHELCHVLVARLLGYALISIRPSPVGVRARLKCGAKSFKKQVAVFIAGPLGNLFLAFIFSFGKGFFTSLSEANLAMGIFNLLPMYPLDGGQIFIIIFYKLMGSSFTFKLIKKLMIIVKSGIIVTGVLQIFLFGNPSLIMIFILLPGTRLLEETVSVMKLENLLNRKQRIISKGIYPARHIVVMDECTLGDVLQRLDYDRFHIICILDSNLEIVGQITEQHIIKAMETCNASDKISDVFFLGL